MSAAGAFGCGDDALMTAESQMDAATVDGGGAFGSDQSAVVPEAMDASVDSPGDDSSADVDASVLPSTCNAADLTTQEICGEGRACRVELDADDNVVHRCGEATETGTQAVPCAADTDCAVGFACVNMGAARACTKYCNDANPCENPLAICLSHRLLNSEMNANDLVDSGARVCTMPCDLLTGAALDDGGASCPAGSHCLAFRDEEATGRTTGCFPVGIIPVGQPCMFINDCVAGATCALFSTEEPGVCQRWCDFSAPDRDAPCDGQSCRPGGIVIEGRQIGVCG